MNIHPTSFSIFSGYENIYFFLSICNIAVISLKGFHEEITQ